MLACGNYFFLFQGEIERQGNYNDILRSGIDFASILRTEKTKDADVEKHIEKDGIMVKIPSRNSEAKLENSMTSKTSLNSDKGRTEEAQHLASSDEEKELLKKLEASSRGKVKGSLLVNYLKSSNQPCTLVLLIVSFLLVQILASLADIFVSYW